MRSSTKRKYGILFVHGIVGNCHIFDFLRNSLPNDFELRYLLLEGHGGNALDFSRTSMSVWKSQVEKAVDDMASTCESIIGVGHSMGCLLILEQAMSKRVSALFLLNPPLNIRISPQLFTNALKVAFDRTKDDAGALAAKEAYGISLDHNPLHYYGWPRRYCELFSEIRRVRKDIVRGISCPICVIIAGKDEMVATSSMQYFSTLPASEIVYLPESHHYYYTACESEIIQNKFSEFLSHAGTND